MADFTSSGLWDEDDEGIMIDYDELKISESLAKESEAWINFYDTCFEDDYDTFKKGMSEKLNATGLELAKKLKMEIPNIKVSYWHELDGTDWKDRIRVEEIK